MGAAASWKGARIYTIGHSTRTVDSLVALLRPFKVSVLADIRTIPRSRHNPQFNAEALRTDLRSRSIRYVHLAGLGGLRKPRTDSHNTAWRNASFRGFADYMGTADFERALEELRPLAAGNAVALMCAETVPWRCHRSLVADVLTARGARVEHVIGSSRTTVHRLSPLATVEAGRVRYPGEGSAGGRLATRPPFHLEATVRVLQRRPSNPVDMWEPGRYLRVVQSEGELALIQVENRGTIDAPDVRFFVRSGEPSMTALSGLQATLRKVLGLDVDPEPLQRLSEVHRALRPTALALRGMRPPRFADWFEAFANVVPFQQVSLDAGLAIVGRLVERFGSCVEQRGRRFRAFPSAAAIAGARLAALRECGLSARKAQSLRYLARAIETGHLTESKLSTMGTDDALQALRELPGIGPWSAALLLLRGLGRIDVFPPGDVGAARRLGTLMRLRSEASLRRVIERFGEQRGYLYFLGLGGSLLAMDLIHAAPEAR
jgi:DNA-3-methyladenine glycosylase II